MHKAFNKLFDLITGFDIAGELQKVLKFDEMSQNQIHQIQLDKFNLLKKYACRSAMYKNFLNKDYKSFPIVNRESLKKDFHKFLTNFRKPYSIQHSSGSTSDPISIIVSREMLLAKRVSHQKMLHWFGIDREAKEFKIGGVKESMATQIYYYLKNKRYYNSFRINEDTIKRIITHYNKFKPIVLYGYPSAIFGFIQMAHKKDLKLHSPKVIATHAENLYPEIEEKFASTFPESSIANQYWATESNIAVSCPQGNLHIDEDSVICETINMNENGVGDLIITNLHSYDFPIIRYKIGDRVKLSDKLCPCGRKTKIIEYIEGREIEFIELPDGRKINTTALYLSRYSDNILSYQIVYIKSRGKLIFKYLPIHERRKIRQVEISKTLKEYFGLPTEFEMISKLEYTKGGKFRKLEVID
jgi:phenylacetate-CoA ligase